MFSSRFEKELMDVKMGTAESSQSSELAGIAGLTSQASFHRQSPNIARLIRSENSSKMEYEFPISDVPNVGPSTNIGKHGLHSAATGSSTRSNHSSSSYTHSPSINEHQSNHTGYQLSSHGKTHQTKLSSDSSSSLWFTLTSCFGCRTRSSSNSSMNPLRDKVHAIRIVRASNDLTPAVFDSHYNIITLEQLRECDNNNATGNVHSLPNEMSNAASASAAVAPSNTSTTTTTTHNGNGSVPSNSSTVTGSKKDKTHHRMRKKKKKRVVTSKPMAASDDDDDYEDEPIDHRSGRT